MGIAIVLAILFGIALFTMNDVAWLTTVVLDEENFVATFESLPQDEAVSLALAHKATGAFIENYEVTERIAEALPEGIRFVAVPLTEGLRDMTEGIVTEIVRSDGFNTVWTAALTGSHRIASTYVGAFEREVLDTQDGVAVLDLTPVAVQISEALAVRGFDIALETQRDLTVELFELPDSGFIKLIVDVMYTVRVAIFVLTFGLAIGAFAIATNRRRIAKWIGGATVVSMLLSLVAIRYARSALTGGVEDPTQREGAEAAWNIIFQQFIWQTWAVLLLGVTVILVAWIMGESESATALRSAVGTRSESLGTEYKMSSAMAFVAAHRRLIEWGSGVAIIGFLLFGPALPLWLVFLVLVVLVLIIVGVESVATLASEEEAVVEPVG
jgi:hypothetical protein